MSTIIPAIDWRGGAAEKRQTTGYTDGFIRALLASAEGTSGSDPSESWALETAANLYARAFAAAKITGRYTDEIKPAMMALIARNMIRRGSDIHIISTQGGSLSFIPVGSWDVYGGDDEKDWMYRTTIYGPDALNTRYVPGPGILHFRYSFDSARPWRGIPPLGWATDSGALAGNLERRLSEEAGGPVAHILPIPQDGGSGEDDDPLAQLKSDIAGAKGRTILSETTAAGWGEGMASAPRSDWKPMRLGAHPPDVLRGLRSDVGMAVLSACGIPVSLATDADGTSQRESWRRFVMGAVEPLLEIVVEEMQAKLETKITFDLSGLWAHDLAGRAASFQKLIAGGMELERAVAASGLVMANE